MAKEQEKVLIIDDKTQNAMRLDPEYADFKAELEKEDFKVICLDDRQNIELFSDTRKPIGDYQGIAVRSDLYKTDKCYYPMLDFAESYFEHLNLMMEDMAACMGASLWEFNYLEEQFESSKQSSGFDASVNVNIANKGGGGVGYAQSNTSGNSDESKYSNTTKAKFEANRKKSPQEFEAYIKEQEIDIDVFDPHFKDRIQRYIKGEEVLDLEKTIDKSKRISQYVKTCHKLSANAKICRIFDAKFKLDLKSELNTERKYRTKLFYRMTFENKR
ncbi:hypothetical protein [Helicobacter sp. 23-1045]